MSFLSQAYLLDKYGPRLTMAELAEVLGVAYGTLCNRLSAGTLKCRTYYDGGTRYAAYRIRPASAPIARPRYTD